MDVCCVDAFSGGKICLTIHFNPLWAKNVPRFGIAHALALGVSRLSHSSMITTYTLACCAAIVLMTTCVRSYLASTRLHLDCPVIRLLTCSNPVSHLSSSAITICYHHLCRRRYFSTAGSVARSRGAVARRTRRYCGKIRPADTGCDGSRYILLGRRVVYTYIKAAH